MIHVNVIFRPEGATGWKMVGHACGPTLRKAASNAFIETQGKGIVYKEVPGKLPCGEAIIQRVGSDGNVQAEWRAIPSPGSQAEVVNEKAPPRVDFNSARRGASAAHAKTKAAPPRRTSSLPARAPVAPETPVRVRVGASGVFSRRVVVSQPAAPPRPRRLTVAAGANDEPVAERRPLERRRLSV